MGQTTISPHSLAYYAVGGGICCREDPNGLVPGLPAYDSSGLTRNAGQEFNLLGLQKRCNCKGFEKFDARSDVGGPPTGHKLVHFRNPGRRRRSVRTAPGVPVGDRLWAVRPMGPVHSGLWSSASLGVERPVDSGVDMDAG